MERQIARIRPGILGDADAGEADPRAYRNLFYGRKRDASGPMAVDGGEDLATGNQDILVLRVLPNLHNHPRFNRDQIVDMPAPNQVIHGHRPRSDGSENRAFLNLAASQRQEAV